MRNLQFLYVPGAYDQDDFDLLQGLQSTPPELTYLSWDELPFEVVAR